MRLRRILAVLLVCLSSADARALAAEPSGYVAGDKGGSALIGAGIGAGVGALVGLAFRH